MRSTSRDVRKWEFKFNIAIIEVRCWKNKVFSLFSDFVVAGVKD